MAVDLQSIVSIGFMLALILLAIAGSHADRRMDVSAKRRWAPRWVSLIGVSFIGFSASLSLLGQRGSGVPWIVLGFLGLQVVAIAVSFYHVLKVTRYCDKCNATQYPEYWCSPPLRFCSKCGAEMGTAKPPAGDGLLE